MYRLELTKFIRDGHGAPLEWSNRPGDLDFVSHHMCLGDMRHIFTECKHLPDDTPVVSHGCGSRIVTRNWQGERDYCAALAVAQWDAERECWLLLTSFHAVYNGETIYVYPPAWV